MTELFRILIVGILLFSTLGAVHAGPWPNEIFFIGAINPMGLSSSKAEAAKRLLTIGGRDVSGPFYPTAGSIANAVNQKREEHGIRIMVKAGPSSVSGLNAVISGEVDFGAVQLSRIYQAHKNLAGWKDIPRANLCSIFNTHAESITLIASVESGIRTIRDLRDKRVGIGSPGSDLHVNAIEILTAVGIDYETDISVADNRIEAAPDLLQDGEIDAFFYPVGALSRPFVDLISGTKKVRLVSIAAPGIDSLIAAKPFYEKAMVPMTLYPGLENKDDVEALNVKTSLITTCEMPNRIVSIVTKGTLENYDNFKKMHPAASMMTKRAMLEDMITPVHPGAMKYYKESGMDAMLRPQPES